MNDQPDGFVADTEALSYYINRIVDPALDNFGEVASKLSGTTSASHQTMIGQSRLDGSSEFTDSCERLLTRYFEAHHAMTDLQRDLVRTVTNFRDNLQQSAAAYIRNDARSAQFLGRSSARLDGLGDLDGAT
jgi:hypothetical protein